MEMDVESMEMEAGSSHFSFFEPTIGLERGDLVLVELDYFGLFHWPAIVTGKVKRSKGQSYWVTFIQNRPTHERFDRSKLFLCAIGNVLTVSDDEFLPEGRFNQSGMPNSCWPRSVQRLIADYLPLDPEERVAKAESRAGHFNQLEESRVVGKGRQRYCLCQTEMRKKTKFSNVLMVMCHDCQFWYHLKCLRQATKRDSDGQERPRYPHVIPYVPQTEENESYWCPWYCPICIDSDSDGLVEDEILPAKISVDKKESKGRGRPKKKKSSGPGDEGMAPVEE